MLLAIALKVLHSLIC